MELISRWIDGVEVEFRPSFPVLTGDLLVLLAFVAVGLLTHDVNPLEEAGHWLQTAAPFVLGWLVMSSVAGAQSSRALSSYRYAVATVSAAWITGVLLGAFLRYTPRYVGGATVEVSIALEFTMVMTFFGLLFMLPWRLAAVYLTRQFAEP